MSPPQVRTIKTLAAALTQKWIVHPDWITQSKDAGHFIDETKHGFMNKGSPLFHKKIMFSAKFLEENQKNQQSRIKNCELLVKNYGKGSITKDLHSADIVLVSNNDNKNDGSGALCLTWEKFIELIFPKISEEGSSK